MFFLTLGLWRSKVLPSPSTRPQIQTEHYYDQKWRLKANCPCYLKLWATGFPNSLSKVEDLLLAVWPITRSFSGAVGSAHCFREQGWKYWSRSSKPAAKADGQEPSRSWKAAKLVSRCLPAWDHSTCLRLPPNSRQKPDHFSQRPSSRDISESPVRPADELPCREYCSLWGNAFSSPKASYDIGCSVAQRFQASTLWFSTETALLPLKNLTFLLLPQRKKS